ncbi:hypothetical protein SAMN04488055_3474 [Chitinophaga niabensis]|uniref:Uncharacterized protein n=1 Tax=Chitinophaga niabensis TaxID=536979 RepID=A0A1N6IZ22_9BACT|nr:hypothetical protein SAMN04488055_3474 [Chitinophaga niabensis]
MIIALTAILLLLAVFAALTGILMQYHRSLED